MNFPGLTIVSDGINRFVPYREPLTKPVDAVIWLHGGDTFALAFLSSIRSRSIVIDVVPQGLTTGGMPGWVKPWEAPGDLPDGAPDNLVDMRFVCALEKAVRAKFKYLRRVWLCGFSSGAGLAWSLWPRKNRSDHSFSGIATVGNQLHHRRENGWEWDADTRSPIPFVLVHGMLDEPDEAPDKSRISYSWVDSYAEARKVNGNTANKSADPPLPTCCGENNFVRLKVASGGAKPSARYTVDQVDHVWQCCDTCHTDDLVIERFVAYGLAG